MKLCRLVDALDVVAEQTKLKTDFNMLQFSIFFSIRVFNAVLLLYLTISIVCHKHALNFLEKIINV